jgi:multisubunit Na+/H+ antiporter MnhF subunit
MQGEDASPARFSRVNEYAYLAMVVWAVTGMLLSRNRSATPSTVAACGRKPANATTVALLCAALAALMTVGLRWMLHGAIVAPFGAPGHAFPIAVSRDFGPRDGATSDAELVIAMLESACLFALYRTLAGRSISRRIVAIVATTFLAMLALALASPVANSSDMYAYAAYAREPLRAYAPGRLHFGGDYAAIDAMLAPIPPCVYGPLWLTVSHFALVPFARLATSLVALRGLEAGALLLCLWALRRIAVPFAVLALLAVDPAVFGLWIVDGHNDLFGVSLLVVALAVRKHRSLRTILIVMAGLVKLPLVAIGSMLLADESNLGRRVARVALAIATCLLVSYALAGPAYFRYILAVGTRTRPFVEVALTSTAVAFEAFAFGAAIVARRFVPGLSWIWPSFSAYPAGWYGIWGLPYAFVSGAAPAFLIAEPAVAYLFCWNYEVTPLAQVASLLAVVVPLGYGVVVASRARRTPRMLDAVTAETRSADTTRAWV